MKRKGHVNYRWQKQQETRRQYEKQKKIKDKWEKMPVDASEELDYIKKLLNGEDVGNFGPEEPPKIEPGYYEWFTSGDTGVHVKDPTKYIRNSSSMSLSELLDHMSKSPIKRRRK
jgi:hypothetical protein